MRTLLTPRLTAFCSALEQEQDPTTLSTLFVQPPSGENQPKESLHPTAPNNASWTANGECGRPGIAPTYGLLDCTEEGPVLMAAGVCSGEPAQLDSSWTDGGDGQIFGAIMPWAQGDEIIASAGITTAAAERACYSSAGSAVCEELDDIDATLALRVASVARAIFVQFASGAIGALDRRTLDVGKALQLSSSYSVLFSSRPFTAYAAKPLGKIRTLVLLLAWTGLSVFHCQQVLRGGRGSLDRDLLRVRQFETILRPANESAIVELGLLLDGCKVSSVQASSNSIPLVLAGKGSLTNGYFFAISGNSTASWVLEGSDDDGMSWSSVGACSWVTVLVSLDAGSTWQTIGGKSSFFVGCSNGVLGVDLNEQAVYWASSQFRVDYRPDIPSVVITMGFFVMPMGWFCALCAILKGWHSQYKTVLGTTLLAFGVWVICWCVVAWIYGLGWRRVFYLFLIWDTLAVIVSSCLFIYLEKHLVSTFFIAGFLVLVQYLVLCFMFYDRDLANVFANESHSVMNLLLSLYLLVGSLAFYFLRLHSLKRARLLLVGDHKRYDGMWRSILSQQEGDISKLLLVVPPKLAHGAVNVPRQVACSFGAGHSFNAGNLQYCQDLLKDGWKAIFRSRAVRPGFESLAGPSSLFDSHVTRQPLQSLDQLYVQAMCLEPILLISVRKWAAVTNGCFPRKDTGYPGCESGPQYIRYADVKESEYSSEYSPTIVKWTHLKSADRAIEKIIRSYGHDVSRLADVCRQSIVFETVKDMTKCMSVMVADPDIELLRIKNRYDPRYDSSQSGGYRDININLRVRSHLALLLGVETHVCEVQLVLQCIAELKNEEGHRNYVTCRNLRAE